MELELIMFTQYEIGNAQGAVFHSARKLGYRFDDQPAQLFWTKDVLEDNPNVLGVYYHLHHSIWVRVREDYPKGCMITLIHEMAHAAMHLSGPILRRTGGHTREWANLWVLGTRKVLGADWADLVTEEVVGMYNLKPRHLKKEDDRA